MVEVLYLVRHSKAEESHPDGDRHRPLSQEGVRRITTMVPRAANRGFLPDLLVASPYLRAVQTRDLFFPSTGIPCELSSDFTPGADPRDALEELLTWEASGYRRIAVFTHNPFVTDLAALLLARRGALDLVFHPPTIAAIGFDQGLEVNVGRLLWTLNP